MNTKYNLSKVITSFLRGYVAAEEACRKVDDANLPMIYVGVVNRYIAERAISASRHENQSFASGVVFFMSRNDMSGKAWTWKKELPLLIDQFQPINDGPRLALAAFAADTSRDMTLLVNDCVDDDGTNFYAVETGIQCQGKAIARNDFGKITFFDNCA